MDALNGKPIDKRAVAVDFSLPKDKYVEATTGVVRMRKEIENEKEKIY